MFLGGEMAGFKRARYLSCFYCGCKTSTRYDGKIKQFDCPKCEATNHLDAVSYTHLTLPTKA